MILVSGLLKRYLALRYLIGRQKIVIASSGRAGSTLLFNSIKTSFVKNRCGLSLDSRIGRHLLSLSSGFVSRLCDIQSSPNVIIKTHDVWRRDELEDALYIFIHADPLDSALSVQAATINTGMEWFKLHQNHLGASGDYERLFIDDVLNYKQQIGSWCSAKQKNILCLAYEEMWEKDDVISEFLGFKVELPEKRKRTSKSIPETLNFQLFDDLRSLRREICR